MARTARQFSKNGTYHVVLRGFNRQKIFFDTADRKSFLERLKRYKDLDGHKILAYILMESNMHLIVQEGKTSISRFMQQIQTSFVYYYNKKYNRQGAVFQDRYSSEPLETELEIMSAMRYVHQIIANDYSEHMHSPLWTSYNAYLNDDDAVVDIELITRVLKTKDSYFKFMNMIETHKFMEPTLPNISDGRVYLEISRRLKPYNVESLKELHKNEQKKVLANVLKVDGVGLRQLSRVAEVGLTVIRGIKSALEQEQDFPDLVKN